MRIAHCFPFRITLGELDSLDIETLFVDGEKPLVANESLGL